MHRGIWASIGAALGRPGAGWNGSARRAVETVNRRACPVDMPCVRSGYRAMALLRLLAAVALVGAALPASAEMVMFSQRNFQGTSYALQTGSNSLSFSPRAVRVPPDQPWELCPRPFFGGTCITVSQADPKLNLPRAFSGMVRSARPAAADRTGPDAPAETKAEGEPKS